MKSRTSSFNLTVFRKDLTRFAPAWGMYLIVLMLILVAALSDGETFYRINNVESFVVIIAWINLFYAALVAQLVFGDLYNSRLCYALHAMPVTRIGWFVTHTAAGLVFSLIPNLALAALAIPMLNLGAGWAAIPLWLLGSSLQYVFFFGVAVLCVMLAGSRLGMLALYAIVQFAGLIAYWLASCIYEPLLHGIQINGELFYPFCPVAEITQYGEIFAVDYERIVDEMGVFSHYEVYGVAPGEGWSYMAICAAVGILALAGALVLYRKRKLECAGDFVAFKAMEPVVLVLVTIFAGGVFHLFGDAIFGLSMKYVLLFTGMIVGFFACAMLLERSTRVFRKDTVLDCGSILLLFALTLAVTAWDPAGITRYMPDAEEVESVTVSDSYSIHRHGENRFDVAAAADMEAIMDVHSACIDKTATNTQILHPDAAASQGIHLEYRLKNGKTVHRIYYVNLMTDAGQVLESYFTTPECVLGFTKEQVPEMAGYIFSFFTEGKETNIHDLGGLDLEGLLYAMVADCEAGNMAQPTGFHIPDDYDLYDKDFDPYITSVEIGWDRQAMEGIDGSKDAYGVIDYKFIRIHQSCTNTLQWLEENDLLTEEQKKETEIDLGGPTSTFTTG